MVDFLSFFHIGACSAWCLALVALNTISMFFLALTIDEIESDETVIPSAFARAMPRESGSCPANNTHSNASDRRIFDNRSLPILPVPSIATGVFVCFTLMFHASYQNYRVQTTSLDIFSTKINGGIYMI